MGETPDQHDDGKWLALEVRIVVFGTLLLMLTKPIQNEMIMPTLSVVGET